MNNSSPVRWAILGAGKIAHSFAKDFSVIKNAEIVAVASRDKQRAKKFAETYSIPEVLSYDELYNSKDVDAVYICTTHNFHFEHAKQCLMHNKAVLCEKPVTINDTEFKQLVALAKEKDLFLMEALWTLFLPPVVKAKHWIEEGRIGKLKIIKADFSFPAPYHPEGRLYNPHLAGGALLDLGIYPIAFSMFYMNRRPEKIIASSIMSDTHVDERTSMILEYGDVTAHLFCSIVDQTQDTGWLFGEEGYIVIPEFWKARKASLYDAQNNLVETFSDDRATLGYNYEIQEATNCLLARRKESETIPLSQSNALQEIMTEIRKQVGFKYPME